MPRIARGHSDGLIYHILNRGNCRQDVFHKDEDYKAFTELLAKVQESYGISILAYCLMPNHFHLLLQPVKSEDLSRSLQWLMTTHVRRYHRHYKTSGHVWQGRYKSFIVQEDNHLLTVARYIEGNPVRGAMTASAEAWHWSSHKERTGAADRKILSEFPVVLPANWTEYVDMALTSNEVERLRRSVNRQAPYGSDIWMNEICKAFGMESTIRKKGRPAKDRQK
jgi:putative transposase